MKWCPTCRTEKPESEFHKDAHRGDGLQSECKPCRCERAAARYAANPAVAELRAIRQRATRRRLRGLVLEYLLAHPCVDCGEDDPVVLEFDHLGDKVASISVMVQGSRTWAAIQAEMLKCDVVCANCHRRRTARRHGGWWRAGGAAAAK